MRRIEDLKWVKKKEKYNRLRGDGKLQEYMTELKEKGIIQNTK